MLIIEMSIDINFIDKKIKDISYKL
jgi:hypothetical protein